MEDPATTDAVESEATEETASDTGESEEDYEAMLLAAVEQQLEPPKPGDLIEGRVIHVGESFVVMDIGYRVEGVIPIEEVQDEAGQVTVAEGDQLKCIVLRFGDDAEYIPLSKRQADFRDNWAKIEQAYQAGEPLEGKVTRRLRGGYFVEISGIRAFLPGSQVDIQRVRDYDEWLGRTIRVKVLSMDPSKRTIIVSRRVLLEEERERQRQEILSKLHPGAVLEGRVKNITGYGVFVDLGGIDGMIHKSDLAWHRVEHPSEVVELGQTLKVKVLAYDPERERVSLGLKQLQPEPFSQVLKKYREGDVVTAKVTNVVDYGAFVEIEPGVTGLIHVTEMTWAPRTPRPDQVVKPGDEVEVRIIEIDRDRKRISLSLRQVQPNPVEKFLEEHPPGSIIEARVARFNMRGAIVEIKGWPEVMGFIPVREINWSRKILPPSEHLSRNQVVKAKVLRGRPDLVRVYLSIRQLEENPWEKFASEHSVGERIKVEVGEKFERGCFVKIPDHPDLEALLPRGHYKRIRKGGRRVVVEPEDGEALEVKIIQMDPKKRRIVVSIREIEEEKVKKELEEARKKAKKSDKVRIGDIITKEIEKLKQLARRSVGEAEQEAADAAASMEVKEGEPDGEEPPEAESAGG